MKRCWAGLMAALVVCGAQGQEARGSRVGNGGYLGRVQFYGGGGWLELRCQPPADVKHENRTRVDDVTVVGTLARLAYSEIKPGDFVQVDQVSKDGPPDNTVPPLLIVVHRDRPKDGGAIAKYAAIMAASSARSALQIRQCSPSQGTVKSVDPLVIANASGRETTFARAAESPVYILAEATAAELTVGRMVAANVDLKQQLAGYVWLLPDELDPAKPTPEALKLYEDGLAGSVPGLV